ncbi:hypothetical protein P3T76_001856 [Phytophthora citrophthora]|uniref:Uncharacterized protein n=1 Tax=Phytophthora citrophthora TaxID=4793 RepID=A0AAD9GY50_9STRA|nr:hypothetical protein P3T76_001856 [Phytophthora citrophthora]
MCSILALTVSAGLRLSSRSLHLMMELTFAYKVGKLDTKVPEAENVLQVIFVTEFVVLLG